MGFRMIPPKRLKKAKSEGSEEVLRRLKEYLDENSDEPVRMLCGFWEDQRRAITYQELREAILEGKISTETIRLWQQDYSILVRDKLSQVWTEAMAAGPSGQPIFDGKSFVLDMQTPGITSWIKERGAEFVTNSTQEQKDAIACLLSKKMRDSHTVDELAKMIRPCIGLTVGQASANAKYYDTIVATLSKDHPRMSKESIHKKALDASTKYAERQHRQRAITIAQTESAFAYNRGADQGVRQAIETGLLGTCKKVWSTSGDDAVCETCQALEGTEIGMDDDFDFKGRLLFVGHKMLPPAHPLCACAVEYIEVEPPKEVTPEILSTDEDIGIGEYLRTYHDSLTRHVPPITLEELDGPYAETIKDKIASGEASHRKLLEAHSDKIGFAKTNASGKIRINETGIYVNFEDDVLNPRGAYTSTFHEMGHAVDRILGRPSEKIKMSDLVREDAEAYVEFYMKKHNLTRIDALEAISNKLAELGTRKTHIVADLMSGIFGEDCVWPAAHKASYWKVNSERLGHEAFAHFFGANALGYDDKLMYARRVFQKTYAAYTNAIMEAAKYV